MSALILTLALVFASSCSVILEKEFSSITEYTETVESGPSDSVSSYTGLKLSMRELVEGHVEAGKIIAANYQGNLRDDVGQACLEIQTMTPIGAYAVEYISTMMNQIVSYYEIDIHIAYKRTKEQVDAVAAVSGLESLRLCAANALEDALQTLAVNMTTGTIDAAVIKDIIYREFLSNPLAVPRMPDISVSVYPETGLNKIFEINLDYAMNTEDFHKLRDEMRASAAAIVESSGARQKSPANAAMSLMVKLSELAENNNGTDDSEIAIFPGELTAYTALVTGTETDSVSLALAYNALLSICDIKSEVVIGERNGDSHAWCIVTIDGERYHADPSSERGAVFLKGDVFMTAFGYSWDGGAYPKCPGDYTN